MAAGGLAVAATLALGVAGASAQTPAQQAPNPGPGYNGTLPEQTSTGATGTYGVSGATDNSPTVTAIADGPQTANVPTLAWAGEAVRLVACDSKIYYGSNAAGVPPEEQTADWSTENWTGDQGDADIPTLDGNQGDVPLSFMSGSNGFFSSSDLPENANKGCVTATVKSTHSGLWQGKLNVYTLDFTEYTEQFIVIWMNPLQPVITESSVNSLSYPGGSTVDQLSNPLGVTNLTGGQCLDLGKYTDNSGLPLSGPYNCLGYLGDPAGGNPSTFNPSLWPDEGECSTINNGGNCVPNGGSSNIPSKTLPPDTTAPDHNNGLIDIRVSGTFPVEDLGVATTNQQCFGSIDGGGNPGLITLPAEWPQLANVLAESSVDPQDNCVSSGNPNAHLWDIHGGPTNPDWHVEKVASTTGYPCPADSFGALFNQLTDAVNNCLGTDLYFSRVFGDTTSGNSAPGSGSTAPGSEPGPTVGPYDDEAPNETLLSDGNLNADDAPMPALPVTVSIAPNLGGTDLGGVGGLYSADKELIYSHNWDGNTTNGRNTVGNLYNPYYYEYIPSTDRYYNESSGITGIAGDNFPGFDLVNNQPYKFWTAEDATTNNKWAHTICLRRSDAGYSDDNGNKDRGTEYYPEPDPSQADSVIVETDERGEAFVDYNPGDGFYLNNLIAPDPGGSTVPGGSDVGSPLTIGDNGVCDLSKLPTTEIGYSSISASVQYPYQGVDYPNPPASKPLVKVVDSLWNKTLTAYPSYTGQADTSDFVTTANDINGQPFPGEVVCFTVSNLDNAAAGDYISLFGQLIQNAAGTYVADTTGDKEVSQVSSNEMCVRSNYLGEAGIQVSGSETGVDVTATFTDEAGLTRDVMTTLGGPPKSDGTPPVGATVIQQGSPVASTGTSGSSSSNSSSSGSSNGSTGSSPVVNVIPLVQKAKTANVYKVEGLRLVRGKHGKYAAIFKLSGARGALSVTIRAYRANGKLLRTYRITVRANTVVSVNVGTKVAHVTVIA
jgi:hypothetical protein